jgi:predicted sulfurtransferase
MSHGYGRFWTGTRYVLAHRMAASAADLDPKVKVCHRCDNPICCNPAHLFLGTQADNLSDMWRKARGQHGSQHYAAKLTEEQVAAIRAKCCAGVPQRQVAAEFGVGQQTVSQINRGRTWRRAKPVRP